MFSLTNSSNDISCVFFAQVGGSAFWCQLILRELHEHKNLLILCIIFRMYWHPTNRSNAGAITGRGLVISINSSVLDTFQNSRACVVFLGGCGAPIKIAKIDCMSPPWNRRTAQSQAVFHGGLPIRSPRWTHSILELDFALSPRQSSGPQSMIGLSELLPAVARARACACLAYCGNISISLL